MALLEVRNLSKRFGGLAAVNDVSLDVGQGEILGLIGPNGAGKTTFVNLLTGALPSTSGTMLYEGRDVTRLGPHQRCRLGMARTFQVPQPFGGMTVLENVMTAALFGSSRTGRTRNSAEARARAVLDDVGLGEAADDRAVSLTTAGLKRLELARCLATEPSLIFLDEPLGGLNQTEVTEALDLIRSVRSAGATIIFIEHIMKAVMAVSDRVVVLANGAKLAEGTPSDIVADEQVQLAYLGDVSGAVDRYARLREGRTA
ncbi:MAG: ABC transporter ATP-binding protein [Tistlia sp.]|uniref:ABC transporter ATP-binding protein n=1 Tax=Tistlia sp. TaxID=3057121 RepID=UPI0034A4C730